MPIINQRYSDLRAALVATFDKKGLEVLCFDLGVEGDRIPDFEAERDVWAASIIRYFAEQGMLGELIEECKKSRPNVDWQAILDRVETRRATAECPYPGMVPFTEANSALFFGRDDEIESIIEHFRYQRFLLVIGSSGSGKSSLIRAGVLPRLNQAAGHEAQPWLTRIMQPGVDPLRTLNEILPPDRINTEGEGEKHEASQQRLLLVVDQFEALFSLHSDEPTVRNAFIAALKQLYERPDCAVLVVIRADFYDALMRSPLWECIGDRRKDIAPLQGKALRDAIREPAESVYMTIEEALMERLVADADNQPVMPLIQETLRTLWSRREPDRIRLQSYEDMGRDGVSGLLVALENVATLALEKLKTREQRDVARRILLDLVQLGEPGISPDTRRRQYLEDLTKAYGNSVDFQEAMKSLTEQRLITFDIDGNNRAVVDLSHEALIANWKRLKRWLDDSRAQLRLYRQFQADVRDWLVRGQEDGRLYRGTRLGEMLTYAKTPPQPLNVDETLFLKKCRAAEARSERAQYRGQMAGTAIGAALGFGALYAIRLATTPVPDGLVQDLQLIPFIFLLMLPMGAVVGGMIGLGLCLGKRHAIGRIVIPVLFAVAAGMVISLIYALILRVRGTEDLTAQSAMAGALLGGGLGLGIGFGQSRTRSFVLTVLLSTAAGVAGALLMRSSNVVADALGSALLGILTVLGYEATAVRGLAMPQSSESEGNGDLVKNGQDSPSTGMGRIRIAASGLRTAMR